MTHHHLTVAIPAHVLLISRFKLSSHRRRVDDNALNPVIIPPSMHLKTPWLYDTIGRGLDKFRHYGQASACVFREGNLRANDRERPNFYLHPRRKIA